MTRTIGRRVGVAVAATTVLMLAACGSDDTTEGSAAGESGDSDEAGASDESGESGGSGGLISIITPAAENPFFKAEADTAQAAAEELGYETTVASHDDDPAVQSDLIDNAIASDAAAIILDNAGADESIGAVQRAADEGIPVYLIDREINETGIATAQIVSNNAQGATLGAQEFVDAMGGEGKYIELTGRDTDTNAHVRSDSYNDVLGQFPDMEQLAQETANWDQQEAFEKMETFIQRFGDEIDGVIAGNDTMALGAVAALEGADMIDDVVVVGFDGSPDAIDAIEEGRLHATVLQPAATLAEQAVQQADEFIKTGEVSQPEKQSIDCYLVTEDNTGDFGVFEYVGG